MGDDWMAGLMRGWVSMWTMESGWVSKWVDDEWMEGWMDERVSSWTVHGWTD